jgi:hypothetical protein
MENFSRKISLLKIFGLIGIGTITFGAAFYFIYKKLFNDKESEFINDYISTNLADIRNQIQEANGNFDEGLKKKIFLKINQTHEKIMKNRFDKFIIKYNLSEKNNILPEDILQKFLQVNWETYKSTTDYILTRIGLSEKEYVELIHNMSLSEYMDYEYIIEKDSFFEGRVLLNKIEAKKAFLEYVKISEIYISSLNNRVNRDNKDPNFDEELQMGVLFSNIKIETQIYLKYKFTPKELLYMMRKYNLMEDVEVKKAYESMINNSPNFYRV